MSFEISTHSPIPGEKELYSFYTNGGIQRGLEAENGGFRLNSKGFQIFSGSLHYFRFLPGQWEDAILRMKACHLNTVCTYVPWNLHEETPGRFNFSGLLNLKAFLELVRKLDMFLILRPGPYICAELDFGGLPSWLLRRDPNMKVRSKYPPFLEAVNGYWTELFGIVSQFQFSVNGGPIIAVQIENEFGSYGDTQKNPEDLIYMSHLKDSLEKLGVKELLFTCDMPSIGKTKGSLNGVLMAACFQSDAETELAILKKYQPDKPLFVAELWSGWFDHWGEDHFEITRDIFIQSLGSILEHNASFNIYVFQGGTNFGFTNGANVGFPTPDAPYMSTVTSYDYGALVTEDGRCTEKYEAAFTILRSITTLYHQSPETPIFFRPINLKLDDVPVSKFLSIENIPALIKPLNCISPVPMEYLNNNPPCVGFVMYQTEFHESGQIEFDITSGSRAIVFINGKIQAVLNKEPCRGLELEHEIENSILSILVENMGRVNFTEDKTVLNNQRRGIVGKVIFNRKPLENWKVFPLAFDSDFFLRAASLNWQDIESVEHPSGFYRAVIQLDHIEDTFIFSKFWSKGSVFINGFNIGRYWKVGPQQTLFVPKELLNEGLNEIMVFELHTTVKSFQFSDIPVLNVRNKSTEV